MKGFVDFHLYNKRIDFKLRFERKLTIIRGNSGARKSLLVKFIYEALNRPTTHISCSYECRILDNSNWQREIDISREIIYFSDEDSNFYFSDLFAKKFAESNGYFVIITRRTIESLPYSINSIYKFKSSGKYTEMERVYNLPNNLLNDGMPEINTLICEDSKSGMEFYKGLCNDNISVLSCEGKSNFTNYILNKLKSNDKCLLVVDGAAFGSNIKSIYDICMRYNHSIFAPESFEYMPLHLKKFKLENFLSDEEAIANEVGSDWISWERYFTELLIYLTKGTEHEYTKSNLNEYYLSDNIYSQLSEHFPILSELRATTPIENKVKSW